VDILAPAGLWPKPDLTTTPPGRTIEVFGGKNALRHLDDIAFLTSLIEDPDELRLPAEHLAMASVLDDRDHHAWTAATNPAVAHLVWETIRDS
jgi:hypothetical protein